MLVFLLIIGIGIIFVIISYICAVFLLVGIAKKRKKYIFLLIPIIATIMYIIHFSLLYDYFNAYYNVIIYMNNFDYKYKIKGVYKKSYADCTYVFNVQLDDDVKKEFQAYYCDSYMFKSVKDNRELYYIQYYYDEHNKNSNNLSKLEIDKEDFRSYKIILHYNRYNIGETCDFIMNLKDKFTKKFNITLKNDDSSSSKEKVLDTYDMINYFTNKERCLKELLYIK